MRKTIAMQYGGKKATNSGTTAASANVTAAFETDETLSFSDGILKVNTAKDVNANNTLPITAAAVYTVVGNISALLDTI